MSKESLEHLNTNTLIGFTDKRGSAWHYRAEHQGDESNHYPGPVPVPDVERRLFGWQAESRRLAVETPANLASMSHLDEDGKPAIWAVVEDRQAIADLTTPPSWASSAQAISGISTGNGCLARWPTSSTTTSPSAPPASCVVGPSPGWRSACQTTSRRRRGWSSVPTCWRPHPSTGLSHHVQAHGDRCGL